MEYQFEDPYVTVPRYASFWARFAASFLDGLIIGIPFFIAKIMIFSSIFENSWTFIMFKTIVGWLYCAGMESSNRQATFGKMALELKVTDLMGSRISFGKATARHFGKWLSAIILFIGYLMVVWTEKKQALHDQIAGTLVVSK